MRAAPSTSRPVSAGMVRAWGAKNTGRKQCPSVSMSTCAYTANPTLFETSKEGHRHADAAATTDFAARLDFPWLGLCCSLLKHVVCSSIGF